MTNNTILNWDDADPKAIYSRQLINNPLYWDEILNTWVTYSYEYCKTILLSEDAHVPEPVIEINTLLNEKAVLLLRNLVRLTNNGQHNESRRAAMVIYNSMKPVSISHILEDLLADVKDSSPFDWVTVVAKKLPLLIILRALEFPENECDFVVENISSLVKIMSPNKTVQDIETINSVVDEFYTISERHVPITIRDSSGFSASIEIFVCNLVGLFIQCYDAGRGLLCNTLLNMVRTNNNQNTHPHDITYFKKLVTETLRIDPPVHNTRRIAVKDILIGNQLIKAGQAILVVIGAANLDPKVFKDPALYDLSRGNNGEHLTFGLGGHNCFAKYTMIDMATEICFFLTNKYKHISIVQQEFKYEPQLNVKLVKELMIKLS